MPCLESEVINPSKIHFSPFSLTVEMFMLNTAMMTGCGGSQLLIMLTAVIMILVVAESF